MVLTFHQGKAMEQTSYPPVSVIVPCRNELKHVASFLDSLLSQNVGEIDLEAIIADGMSDDGTKEVLEKYQSIHPRIRIIANPNRIVSTGLNAAIRAAKGTIIVRMDVHTEYASNYIRKCLEVLRSTGADNVGGPARTKAHGFLPRSVAAAYGSPFSCGGA